MSIELINKNMCNNIAFYVNELEITYEMLNRDIEHFSSELNKGDLVFIVAANDYQAIVFYLSCLKIGAIPLLLNAAISFNSLASLVATYKPNYLFKKFDEHLVVDCYVKRKCYDAGYAIYESLNYIKHKLHPELALLMATSGSTGSPKLVRLTLSNIISNARSISEYLHIDNTDRAITSLPFNYSYGLSVINSHLFSGASLVLTNASVIDPSFWSLITKYEVTSIAGVPYTYEMLLKLRLERLKMPFIRTMTQAGGKFHPDKVKLVADFCTQKGIKFFTMYGQTEATARISYVPSDLAHDKYTSIGKAIPDGKLWIADSRGSKIEKSGVIGELVYEGPNVCMGYAESVEDLNAPNINNGVLFTGDLAEFDEDGYFYIRGRINRFLKIFGVRVSLDAVEQLVMQYCSEVAAHGTDDKLMISIVNLHSIELFELQKLISITLSIHSSAISMNEIDVLPRLSTGKVDYQCLNH